MSNKTSTKFGLKFFSGYLAMFVGGLFLIAPQVFANEVIVETYHSNPSVSVQHQIVVEAKDNIKISEKIILEAIEAKKDAKEFLEKLKLEIEAGGVSEEDIEILEKGTEEVLFEANEDISLAEKVIENSLERIAEAKNTIRIEGVNIKQDEDSLRKLNEGLVVAKSKQQKVSEYISETDEAMKTVERSKSELSNLFSCEPKPDSIDILAGRLYQYVRYHHEWYFHGLGCDEDKLVVVARDFASRSRKGLEEFIKIERQSPPEQGMAKISLKNRLEEERYKECLLRLEHKVELIREVDEMIESQIKLKQEAGEDKQIAEEEVERLEKEINRLR